jgi:hypothetical protein
MKQQPITQKVISLYNRMRSANTIPSYNDRENIAHGMLTMSNYCTLRAVEIEFSSLCTRVDSNINFVTMEAYNAYLRVTTGIRA